MLSKVKDIGFLSFDIVLQMHNDEILKWYEVIHYLLTTK